jgi:hypothetical protein
MAGNTFDAATAISDFYLERPNTNNGSINPGDLNDYYKFFTLAGPSNIYATLTGLTADADLYLYDRAENLISQSTLFGTGTEVINASLQGGQYYYIKVVGFGANISTNYSLELTSDYAGGTLTTARDIGISWGQGASKRATDKITFNDYLDSRDNTDLVKFSLEDAGTISLRKLPGSGNDLSVSMQLLDQNGAVLAESGQGLLALNLDRFSAPAGTYYAKFSRIAGAGEYQYRIATDYAGNTTGTARNLGDITGSSRKMIDMVGNPSTVTYEDTGDLYKFTLSQAAPLHLRLDLNPAFDPKLFNADLRLAQDTNNDGFITSNEVLFASNNVGDDAISLTTLGAGTYYAQVIPNAPYTSYTLNFNSDFDGVIGDPKAYRNVSQARNLGVLAGESFINDGFGVSTGAASDFVDFFKFDMAAAGNFFASVTLDSTSFSRGEYVPDVSVFQDVNNNQIRDDGEIIGTSGKGLISVNLAAGSYYLAITGGSEQSAYGLRSVASYAGQELAMARRMVDVTGVVPTTQVFDDYIDATPVPESDFYRFNLSGDYQVTLKAASAVGTKLALSLIQDRNNNGLIDASEILATSEVPNSSIETIVKSLAAGQYFVQIRGIDGGINYKLTAEFLSKNPAGIVAAAPLVNDGLAVPSPVVASLAAGVSIGSEAVGSTSVANLLLNRNVNLLSPPGPLQPTTNLLTAPLS